MANTILTPQMITREALLILHQKLSFVGNVMRQYDNRFARDGAKIGDQLQIRLPNRYTVRTGATLAAQDTTEQQTTLQVATQKGVDVNFTSSELTLSLDDFSERILEPAMAVLAANIEADAFNMINDVWNQVNGVGSAVTLNSVLSARKKLADNLAPTSHRCLLLNTQDNLDLVDALKSLFQDSTQIARQYREGVVGTTAGFGDIYETTLLPSHTVGTKGGTPLINGAGQTGASLSTDGWNASETVLKKGDIITIAGVNRVHPETRADTGELQQFVVTADVTSSGTGAATVPISPSIVTSGALQNVTGSPADNAAITVVGTASTAHGLSLAFQKQAFAFATADLVVPKGVDFAHREVYEGISMRVVRQYDINNDKFPCRIDVLYGYKAVRPELACRIAAN